MQFLLRFLLIAFIASIECYALLSNAQTSNIQTFITNSSSNAQTSNGTCFTANITSYSWCSGYLAAGYSCFEDYCSSSSCLGDCQSCAQSFENAILDAKFGRCCSSIGSDGSCVGPRDGDAPYNPPYGFPNRGPGGLIIEGPVGYQNGPKVWTPGSEDGAYAFTMLAQPGKSDAECKAPLPSNGSSWTPGAHAKPFSLRSHGEPISDCVIGCNWTDVSLSGIDPCNAGSIETPVTAIYSCYYGGKSWLKDDDLGVCGFNCSVRHIVGGSFCSDADIKAGLCDIYCDPRDFPVGTTT